MYHKIKSKLEVIMKNSMLSAVAVVVMSLVLGSAVVSVTEEHSNANKANRPCAADVRKFCKDVKRGEGRVIECLKSHQSELSQACSSLLAKVPKGKPSTGVNEEPGKADDEE
jgi:hypothetical protein